MTRRKALKNDLHRRLVKVRIKLRLRRAMRSFADGDLKAAGAHLDAIEEAKRSLL
jgi:hypothetical protein